MCPVTLVRTLVEANTVRTGRCADASRLVICIQVEAADQVGRLVVEAGEDIVGRLMKRRCMKSQSESKSL